ncbi:acetylornithine deacetylase [Mesorhizobium sp. SP-1A]|uniref:acetylornithine deacetylase n=1 Tax=Mesorhizobium sp. SP-1A TaxID=3077840 RepID=UPI0028F6DDC0|nr:acetylornithine deacetylase [Mesorhizobium sp. SP-1A]
MQDRARPGELFSLDMIEKFIGFDTTSRSSNLPLIHFVRDYLAGLGVDSVLTYDGERQKANLLATIGPKDRPGVVLSGHTDIVPVDDQTWTSDPFRLARRDGKVFGRGVCDMKGFLAVATAFAPEFLKRDLKAPIHLAMSFDEEVGCLGVPLLIEDLVRRLPMPAACIVGEPSEMKVIRAHKGKIGGHVTVTGLPAHSGVAHQGVNAVEAAGEAIAFFKRLQRRLRDEGPHNADFEAPSYTTIQCCMVNGGTAVNIVAGHCTFDFDIRFLPGENPEDYVNECKAFAARHVEPEMQAVSPETGFAWEKVPGAAALNTAAGAEITRLAQKLSGTSGSTCVGFGTEAGHFQEAGMPTIICGPGSIDQAHKADEFIKLDQVARCESFLWRLLDEVSA